MNKKWVLFALMTMTLSGCTDNGFLFRSGSSYEDMPHKSVYYIGAPYRIKGVLYTPKEDDSYSEKGMAAWYSKDDGNRLTTNGEVFDDMEMTAAHKTLPLPSLVRITNLENGNSAIVRVNDRGPEVNNRLIDVSQKTAEALEFSETGTTLVQVDILPEESHRIREGLEKYAETDTVDSDVVPIGDNKPIYQADDHFMEPIYSGGVQSAATDRVTTEDLPDLEVDEGEKTKPKSVPVSADYVIQVGVFSKSENATRAVDNLSKTMPVQTVQSKNKTIVSVGPFETKEEAGKFLDNVHKSGYPDAWIKHIK